MMKVISNSACKALKVHATLMWSYMGGENPIKCGVASAAFRGSTLVWNCCRKLLRDNVLDALRKLSESGGCNAALQTIRFLALKRAFVSLALLLLASCTGGPTINLGTREP